MRLHGATEQLLERKRAAKSSFVTAVAGRGIRATHPESQPVANAITDTHFGILLKY